MDLQETMIGISRRFQKACPIVLLYDEQMPEFSVSNTLMKVQTRVFLFNTNLRSLSTC